MSKFYFLLELALFNVFVFCPLEHPPPLASCTFFLLSLVFSGSSLGPLCAWGIRVYRLFPFLSGFAICPCLAFTLLSIFLRRDIVRAAAFAP